MVRALPLLIVLLTACSGGPGKRIKFVPEDGSYRTLPRAILLPEGQTSYDCGPESVGSVLSYWKKPSDVETLSRQLVDPALKSTATTKIAPFIRKLGLTATLHPGSMLRLKQAIDHGIPPIIAVRISKELYHYYVISGYNDDLQVVVCEEVGGFKTLLPYGALNAMWAATGHLFLTIEPPTAASTFEEGVEYETVGNYERAIEHYKHALKLDPEFHEARIGMGNCHVAQGELVDARREYETVLSQIPGTPSLWNNLAHVYAELGIHLDEAEDLVGKAVDRYQESMKELTWRVQRTKNEADRFLLRQELNDRILELMYARGTLGQVRFKRKSWTLAIAAWMAALEVAPLDYFDFRAKRYYEMALAYRELGQASDARRHLGKAREIVKEPELRKKIEKALQP